MSWFVESDCLSNYFFATSFFPSFKELKAKLEVQAAEALKQRQELEQQIEKMKREDAASKAEVKKYKKHEEANAKYNQNKAEKERQELAAKSKVDKENTVNAAIQSSKKRKSKVQLRQLSTMSRKMLLHLLTFPHNLTELC